MIKVRVSCLILASLELVEDGLVLQARVEFGRVVDDEDDVGSVDEPLDDIVERVGSVYLLPHFQYARHLDYVYLQIRVVEYASFNLRLHPLFNLFEDFVWQSPASQPVDEGLTEFLQSGECPISGQLGSVQHLLVLAVHQNLEIGSRWFGACSRTDQSNLGYRCD